MNKGLSLAKGDYVLFLNSGDKFYDNEVLNKVYTTLNIQSDVIYGLHKWVHQEQLWNPRRDFKLFEITNRTPIPHQATFYKTDILKSINGFRENYKIISDWAAIFDLVRKHAKFTKIDQIICLCDEPGLSSINEAKIKTERRSFLINHYPLILILGVLYNLKKKF
jgi:predicted transcriptional regulator